MPITQEQLAAKFKQALDNDSNNPEVNIGDARQRLANELAEGVAQFVIGRQVTVNGVQVGGGVVPGTINPD